MPRPRNPNRLVKKTVAVPLATRNAMEAAGPDRVRLALASLPRTEPEGDRAEQVRASVLAVLDVSPGARRATDLSEMTGLSSDDVKDALQSPADPDLG